LDRFVYPEQFGLFLGFRLFGFVCGVFALLTAHRVSPRVARAVALAVAGYETASISIMCFLTGGFASPYLVGVLLCFLGLTTIEAFEPRVLALLMLAETTFYLALGACAPFRGPEAAASTCFIAGTVFFCQICGVLLEAQRRQLFGANAELLTRNVELERAKLQQGKFLSTISHELRSPVNTMLGFAELIEEREENLLPKSRDNLAQVQRSGQHLLRLINDLLDLAKAEAGRMELELSRVDVVPLVQEVAEDTRALVRQRDVTVMVDAPPSLPWTCDPLRFRQILLNLASNAARFTPAGAIEIALFTAGERLVIEVRDTGVGIPPEARALIFEAFRQVHQGLGVGGTGLGLSIVSHLVELLGGRVEVESEVGKGSTFRVTLDALARQEAA
jgi:signal transduction histidine kinase